MTKINWNDKQQVLQYCKKLNAIAKPGFESIVVKHEGRANYNITHKSRTDLYKPNEVVNQ